METTRAMPCCTAVQKEVVRAGRSGKMVYRGWGYCGREGVVIRTLLLGALSAALAALLACAGPSPQPAIADAERAVQLAEEAQARRYAASEMGEALKELRSAREMAQSSSNWIEARRMAEKASVDAELAAERSQAEQLRVSLSLLQMSIREAGDEAGGAGKGNR